jgi:hypothetical protein
MDEEIITIDYNNLKKYILDFSIENELRLELFEYFCSINTENENIELLSRIIGIYHFSGLKLLETFLLCLSENKNISFILRFESSKNLLLFSEPLETIKKNDTEEEIKIINENNIEIKKRNLELLNRGYKSLNNIFKDLNFEKDVISTPYIIDTLCILIKSEKYDIECDIYFRKIINNKNLDCDYRYKIILYLEKKDIKNYKFFIKNACLDFLKYKTNMSMYRILAGQYLLQHCEINSDIKTEIQEIIFSFANDVEMDYNLRADAADTLIGLGDEEYKIKGREIIMLLGRIGGDSKTIFQNAQNVHTDEIEKSVYEILEYLLLYPTLKINNIPIDFDYIEKEIKQIETYKNSQKDEINISLNRIKLDRTLYSKFNNTLSNVLIKVWSYIIGHKDKEQLIIRLLEELVDMSGTCSTGYLSRLVNVLSGFDDKFNIRISFEDQIISNFNGRLNAFVKKIMNDDSPFYKEKLNDVVELYINSNKVLKSEIIKKIETSEYLTDLPPMKKIIEKYLTDNRDQKIKDSIELFFENTINEMMLDSSKFKDRQNFLLFFRTYLPILKEELYKEFTEFVDDTDFDLYIRKAISSYEGINF